MVCTQGVHSGKNGVVWSQTLNLTLSDPKSQMSVVDLTRVSRGKSGPPLLCPNLRAPLDPLLIEPRIEGSRWSRQRGEQSPNKALVFPGGWEFDPFLLHTSRPLGAQLETFVSRSSRWKVCSNKHEGGGSATKCGRKSRSLQQTTDERM